MLDIKYIVENSEIIRDIIAKRQVKADLDELLTLYAQRKSLLSSLDNLRAKANQVAKLLPTVAATEKQSLIVEGRALHQQITAGEESARLLEEAYQAALYSIPNLFAEDTPLGADDGENVVLRTHGVPKKFDFIAKDHVQLGKALQILDFDSGTKVSGSKFYFLREEGVMLELALQLFAMKLAKSFGYTQLITPDVAKKSILIGTGYSPRGEESNIYNVEGLDLSLIATAEITVGGMHANEILEEEQLPLKYVALSHCFRREAGSAGRESKGLYRVHQFSKIELFQITTPAQSEQALEDILALEESIYQALDIPYRVVRICAGDLGAPAYKKYDIEAWMPGRDSAEKYGEVTSASNCTDFQARRLNMRYRSADNKKIFPYTLNGTAIALSRTIVAILENYQEADGSIVIPEALRSYLGKDRIQSTPKA